MVIGFNATFSNILVILRLSVLLMEASGVPRENNRHPACSRQTLSHNVVSSTHRMDGIRTHNVSGDSH